MAVELTNVTADAVGPGVGMGAGAGDFPLMNASGRNISGGTSPRLSWDEAPLTRDEDNKEDYPALILVGVAVDS